MYILNCKINPLTSKETLKKISGFLQSDTQYRIITLNPEYILEAQKDEEFRSIINSAHLSVPDGIGILWAAKFLSLPASECKILRYPQIVLQYIYTGASLMFWPRYCRNVIKERISGAELCERIISKNKRDCRAASLLAMTKIFLLGGYNGAAEIIREKYSDANIVGTFEGSPDMESDKKAREAINQARPGILFVAYGNPASKQEKWISRNLPHLPSVKLAMGVGGCFDFLAERIKRAPEWMQKIGLEWMYRVIRQPKRIGRIWNAVVAFSFQILRYKIDKGTFVIPNPAKRDEGSLR